MADNAGYAYNYLRRKGLTPAQAAGVVGGLSGESGVGLDPNALNQSSGAFGAGQWLGGRKTALMAMKNPNSIKTQMDYLWKELQGPESGAYSALKGTHSIADATRAWVEKFERPSPGEIAQSMPGRLTNARNFFNQFSGQPVRGGSDATGAPPPMGLPGASAATQGTTGNDRLATLAGVMKRLEAATPNIPYNSPLSRTDDPESPTQFGGPPQSNLTQQQPMPGSGFTPTPLGEAQQPTSLGDLLATMSSTRGGDRTTAPGAPTSGGGAGGDVPVPKEIAGAKGTKEFEGTQVAGWIAPILQYGREHGWKGQVNSGFRSFADQTRIYNSGVRPAAKPGTSNHEGAEFPRGAVDVSNAEQLSEILKRSKYKNALVFAGAKDPVHFSHPHGGSY